MIRWITTLIVFFACLPFATAVFTPPTGDSSFSKALSEQRRLVASGPKPERDLILTAGTEIQLDGRVCPMEQVPADAEITLLDLAADRRTIRRVHFQTRK